jgi:hypothetical protein
VGRSFRALHMDRATSSHEMQKAWRVVVADRTTSFMPYIETART